MSGLPRFVFGGFLLLGDLATKADERPPTRSLFSEVLFPVARGTVLCDKRNVVVLERKVKRRSLGGVFVLGTLMSSAAPPRPNGHIAS